MWSLLRHWVSNSLVSEASSRLCHERDISRVSTRDGSLSCSVTECSLLRPSINSCAELRRDSMCDYINRLPLLDTGAHLSPFLATTVQCWSMAMSHLIVVTRKRQGLMVLLPLIGLLSSSSYWLKLAALLHQ
jgi:hypothetical protein